ncbi:MAG: hypothetical protein IKO07_11195 [Clostridia bacterium]|nr:hypothetical protein [Clostridia bacterium]
MPLILALPLCALAALCPLPVRTGFLKSPGAALRVGLAIGAFRRQGSLALTRAEGKLALRLSSSNGERLIPLGRSKDRSAASAVGKAMRFLLRRTRAERLEARLIVNAGDAQSTVLLAALIGAALSSLRAARPGLPLRGRVRCAFSEPGEARLMGIFSLRAGHIMLAALLFCREYCFGRLRAWINTPSKTS